MSDPAILHHDAQAFLQREDRNRLRMTGPAAIRVCELAADAGLVVTAVEGGRWRNPGIEAWLDCIWWGTADIHAYEAAREANVAAANYILSEMGIERSGGVGAPDVFILTAKRYG